MLPQNQRVRKSYEFSRLYRHGRRFDTSCLRLSFLPVRDGVSRFGFVVSKKSTKVGQAAGKIVKRNRMKRVLRDEARKCIDLLTRKVQVVVQVRDGAVKLKSGDLRKEFRGLLERAGLIK